MKKRKIIILTLVIISIFILSLIQKNTYSTNTSVRTFDRTKMQEFVVSTGLSYLYNNSRSDYEQKTMDEKETFNWRTFDQSPEMINRGNYYFIDCSSFVASVYMHSLGYDFSNFYKQSESYVYWPTGSGTTSTGKIAAGKSKENFSIAYKYIGKGINTVFFANIGAKAYNTDDGSHINKYNEYINNSLTKGEIVAYYYLVNGEENDQTKASVKENLTGKNKILRPGDLIIYRRGEADSGHVILYIGDEFDDEGGFIHATGSDYTFSSNTEEISFGKDDYSVKYDNFDLLVQNIFNKRTSTENSSFTVLRPINNYCSGNDCQIETCDNSTCGTGYLNNNVEARVDLNELLVEQYAKSEKKYYDDLSSFVGTKTSTNTLSKYNSVNVGDNITYNVYLVNKSKMSYCTSGNYTNETDCKEAGYEWKQKSNTEKTYDNITITSNIPNNTNFVSCTRKCTYNEEKRTLTWKINSDTALTGARTYEYTVKVNTEENVVNEGIKIITENNNVLQLAPIEIKVNPTINGINVDLLKDEIDKFKSLEEAGKIIYKSNSYSSYKTDLDALSESINMSQFGFIKMIYYNALNIDIGYLKTSTIKQSIFNNDTIDDGYYTKKLDDQLDSLDENYKNISKMLVKGMYGGRLIKGNENLDRAKYLRTRDLEVGDIIVYYSGSNSSIAMFYGFDSAGNSSFVRFESDIGVTFYDKDNTTTGASFLKELYSKDIFVVLRPTQIYGTTIKYEYNGATTVGDSTFITSNTYKNLTTPKKENKTLILNYNQEKIENKTYTGTISFDGWYSDEKFTNKINNTSKLVSTNSHTLYAKWISNKTITLSSPTQIDGYKIDGWYSDSSFKEKIANDGDKYEISENITLYAKWTPTTYTITYEPNGGSINQKTSEVKYNEAYGTLEIPTKKGYNFKGWYLEETYLTKIEKETIVTLSKNHTLYAKWEVSSFNIENLGNYIIKENLMTNIKIETQLNNFQLGLDEKYMIKIYTKDNNVKTNGNIITGDIIKIYENDTIITEYIAVVKGDINGDGKFSLNDVIKIIKHYTGSSTIKEKPYVTAGDINNNDKVDINDIIKISKSYINNSEL